MKYKRRPETVEAMQLTKDNRQEVLRWMGEDPLPIEEKRKVIHRSFDTKNVLIRTFSGEHKLLIPGDYVVRVGADGKEFDVWPRDFFEIQYEQDPNTRPAIGRKV